MLHLQVKVGDLETNCYLLSAAAGGDCLVIDPGADAPRILARIASEKLMPKAVFTSRAVGFIKASSASPISPRFSGVSGTLKAPSKHSLRA